LGNFLKWLRYSMSAVVRTLMVVLALVQAASAQSLSNASDRTSELRPIQRQFHGWNVSTGNAAENSAGQLTREPHANEAQRAFYQQQQSFSDTLPALPSAGFQGQNLGGALPVFPPIPSAQQEILPSSPPPQMNSSAQSVYPSNQQYSEAYNEQTPRQRAVPAQTVGQTRPNPDLPGPQNNAAPPTPNSQAALGLRNQKNYTTGPPFVSPPATGRYPTSPYQGPRYQTTAFQRNAPMNAQTVAAQTGGLTAPGSQDPADFQPVLPQNQNLTVTAYQQCAPQSNFPGTGAVPGAYVPPTLTQNLTPNLYSANNSGYSPLFSLGQENYNVLLGRGLIGQPTVYVPGQPFRNFFRYISP
jgi:hypothetical protein